MELAERELSAVATAPQQARKFITGHFGDHVPEEVLNHGQLLVSELVSNCLRHAGVESTEKLRIRALLSPEVVRVEVSNPGTVYSVRPRNPDRVNGGGFGLYLVEALSHRWGAEEGRDTTVWFELLRQPPRDYH